MPRVARQDIGPRIIDTKNRLSLPPAVMEALGAKAGDHVAFVLEGKGVRLVPVTWSARR